MFLTVWLKRQEIEVRKVQVLASGIGDLVQGTTSKTSTEAYKLFIDAIFPFAAKSRTDTDQKAVDMMRKEAARGPITFSPINTPNPLQKTAKQMSLPDDFRRKLQEKVQAKTQMRARAQEALQAAVRGRRK